MKVLAIILLLVFVILTINHLIFAYLRIFRKKNGYSYVPLVNGFVGLAGVLLYPNSDLARFWWVPFIIDWGCAPMLIEICLSKLIKIEHDE